MGRLKRKYMPRKNKLTMVLQLRFGNIDWYNFFYKNTKFDKDYIHVDGITPYSCSVPVTDKNI